VNGNECFGFHTSRVFIDQMSDCYVLVIQPALWNLLVNERVTEMFLRQAIYMSYRGVSSSRHLYELPHCTSLCNWLMKIIC
jgi:hypothetical protein